eukprot:CAMPEP_0119306050 /NCGR_PEP_ID=MMETSP1333-20130426/6882_1 /TAXON_ID=418940 /ORGANISM="Scyphosphaera apsteinii, Strain RCC1455" /LENGTH=242 /DNA_ID=CAMNT_0007309261 /DNA_START=126 /DNA_END=854 /DNA_ORIENTATION=-
MAEEINFYDEELTELIEVVEKGIDSLRKLNGTAKTERLNELNGRMQRARQSLQSFKVEMRELPRDEVAAYDVKAKAHHATLQKLHGDLQYAKSEAERSGLGLRSVDDMSSAEIIHHAGKTQDESLSALGRMKAQIADTMQVGADTATKLKGQTEQLQNIDTDIMKVKSNLNRADLLIRAFMRRMMTDKIIMVFMCLIFVGIVTIIVYKMVDPKGSDNAGFNVPDQVVDPLGENARKLLFEAR